MPMSSHPPTSLSYGPDNGLYPNLNAHFNSGPGFIPPQPGLQPPMPTPNIPTAGINPQPQGMPHPHIPPSISANSPSYPDAAHAPFPVHPGSQHSPFPDAHSHLSRRDLKKISKAEYKMQKEKYKAQKKADKKAYKAHKKAMKKQGICHHCNHRGSCSCSSSSSSSD